ncbi:hypothetical protein Pyn_40284 [Prunus yedoensis var. nudiflora]|uniref:Uncharacterized protein n=1 Tax=Prunus yedoensis var. nudiflora TaxID=2094558 RepID=A0A314UKY9_PRUYE|nr:hypothetical protein Pyn_40284 [Prunus yedoensis var. nudiflora]
MAAGYLLRCGRGFNRRAGQRYGRAVRMKLEISAECWVIVAIGLWLEEGRAGLEDAAGIYIWSLPTFFSRLEG